MFGVYSLQLLFSSTKLRDGSCTNVMPLWVFPTIETFQTSSTRLRKRRKTRQFIDKSIPHRNSAICHTRSRTFVTRTFSCSWLQHWEAHKPVDLGVFALGMLLGHLLLSAHKRLTALRTHQAHRCSVLSGLGVAILVEFLSPLLRISTLSVCFATVGTTHFVESRGWG